MSRKTPRQAAEAVIHKLSQAGFEALLAGGCVRDLILGQEAKDYDVATSARPDEILRLYPKAQKVGAHFGVVIVRQFGHLVEVATFRTDHDYADGRHPQSVTFTTAEEDAERRDFTINGMFYDIPRSTVVDYVSGQEDLKSRLIRAIGDPQHRFAEDHLRMLRAVRFASRLGFSIEPRTYEAIRKQASRIAHISAERIREELEQILVDPQRASGFGMLRDTGLLNHLWSEARWEADLAEKSQASLAALPAESRFELAVAAMLYHHHPKAAEDICRRLACSNQQRKHSVWLIRSLQALVANEVQTLADLKLLMAGPCFDDLLNLYKAYLTAEEEPLDAHEQLRERALAVQPHDINPPPWVTGDDLLDMGVKQGPIFKKVLDEVYYKQLNLELKDRQEALELARIRSQEAGARRQEPEGRSL